MQNHPSHAALAPFLSKYPQSSGPLFQAYNDVVLAQKWTEIALLDVPSCQRGAIRGTRPLAPTVRTHCTNPRQLSDPGLTARRIDRPRLPN